MVFPRRRAEAGDVMGVQVSDVLQAHSAHRSSVKFGVKDVSKVSSEQREGSGCHLLRVERPWGEHL